MKTPLIVSGIVLLWVGCQWGVWLAAAVGAALYVAWGVDLRRDAVDS